MVKKNYEILIINFPKLDKYLGKLQLEPPYITYSYAAALRWKVIHLSPLLVQKYCCALILDYKVGRERERERKREYTEGFLIEFRLIWMVASGVC